MQNINEFRRSSDSNIFLASDTALGVLEAIYELTGEIPAEGTPAHARWINSLTGLAWTGRRTAREMNAFLYEASDMHRFPKDYADIEYDENEVREHTPFYAVA